MVLLSSPYQNLEKIGRGVPKLWSDIQNNGQIDRETEMFTLYINGNWSYLQTIFILQEFSADFAGECFPNKMNIVRL